MSASVLLRLSRTSSRLATHQASSLASFRKATVPAFISPIVLQRAGMASTPNVHATGGADFTSRKGGPLTDSIKEDHEEMYEYYDKYSAATDADTQARWSRQLIWEIARHAVGEEIVVYPLMEKHLGDQGLKLADEDRAEHQKVKERLYKLESLHPSAADYQALLAELMKDLHKHNDSEEQNDLPLLEPVLGEEGSREAAKQFKRSKMFAPTRAHPSAPNHPPLETLAGFMTAPIDKLKDMFTKFPTEEMKHDS